jgi:hypothetical protein
VARRILVCASAEAKHSRNGVLHRVDGCTLVDAVGVTSVSLWHHRAHRTCAGPRDMSNSVFYEILVNGESLGVFGDENLENMHLSTQVMHGETEIFASGVCRHEDGLYFHNWLQQSVLLDDVVTIRKVSNGPAMKPRVIYKMKPGESA